MIIQSKQCRQLVAPFFCFKMKASSFFIFFLIIFFALHLWLPILSSSLKIINYVNDKKVENKQDTKHFDTDLRNSQILKSFSHDYSDNQSSSNFTEKKDQFGKLKLVDSRLSHDNQPLSTMQILKIGSSTSYKNRRNRLLTSFASKYANESHQKSIQIARNKIKQNFHKISSVNNSLFLKDLSNASNIIEIDSTGIIPPKFTTDELIIIFCNNQQICMIFFYIMVLICFCAKTSIKNCMLFTFGVSNFINSIVYVIALTFVFIFIIFDEYANEEMDDLAKEELKTFLEIMIPLMIVYLLFVFWSGIFMRLSKMIVKGEEKDKSPVLVEGSFS